MNGESCELSNRIEEPDTKIEKNLAKIKIDFFDFFGPVVLAGIIIFFLNTAVPFLLKKFIA